MTIPDKLKAFACYEDGREINGVTDVTLPDLEFMTDTIKGAGINGEIDSPSVGNFKSMTVTVTWRGPMEDNVGFIAPKTYHLIFMGSLQVHDPLTGLYDEVLVWYTVKGIPKKFSFGKFDIAATPDTSSEFEAVYVKLEINHKEVFEIDKFNNIFKVHGVDYLAKTRKNIGKE